MAIMKFLHGGANMTKKKFYDIETTCFGMCSAICMRVSVKSTVEKKMVDRKYINASNIYK